MLASKLFWTRKGALSNEYFIERNICLITNSGTSFVAILASFVIHFDWFSGLVHFQIKYLCRCCVDLNIAMIHVLMTTKISQSLITFYRPFSSHLDDRMAQLYPVIQFKSLHSIFQTFNIITLALKINQKKW